MKYNQKQIRDIVNDIEKEDYEDSMKIIYGYEFYYDEQYWDWLDSKYYKDGD